MKVKIAYTTEVDDDFRRGINIFYSQPGLASRDQVKDWFKRFGDSMDDDVYHLVASRRYVDSCRFSNKSVDKNDP